MKHLIEPNAEYYFDCSYRYLWCHKCYPLLDESIQVGEDALIRKSSLQKEENSNKEVMVQCDKCKCWIHGVCGLCDMRDKSLPYACPDCVIHQRNTGKKKAPTDFKAESIPRTRLSDFLETEIRKSMPNVDSGGKVTIRQVTSLDCKFAVGELARAYYPQHYPSEFKYRSKCILVFQNLDGIDVLQFCLYVQEYDDKCPSPNRRMVYIAYLDSVKYTRPAENRTKIYQLVLIHYVDYVRQRGFEKIHIWSCPPRRKKDDYILWAKPEAQKKPTGIVSKMSFIAEICLQR